jgi:hypothetical protein
MITINIAAAIIYLFALAGYFFLGRALFGFGMLMWIDSPSIIGQVIYMIVLSVLWLAGLYFGTGWFFSII